MVKCKHCGRNIPYDANLCPYCGRSIRQFHQKDNLDEEEKIEEPVAKQEHEHEVDYQMPKAKSDKKLLFFILAVLVLLLIAGLIYRSSLNDSDEPETTEIVKKETQDTDSLNQSKISFNPNKKQYVVVNGEGVRFRFGPSMEHKFLTNEKGAQISVKKGTRLQCVGEKDNWYQVVYNGKRYYMSKDYTYLVE